MTLRDPMNETIRFWFIQMNLHHPPLWDPVIIRIAPIWLVVKPADKTTFLKRIEWWSIRIIVTLHAEPQHVVRDKWLINSTIPTTPLPGAVKAACSRKAIMVWYLKSIFATWLPGWKARIGTAMLGSTVAPLIAGSIDWFRMTSIR